MIPKYQVSFAKSCEGGPSVKYIRTRAKELGIHVVSTYSPYVGQTAIGLAHGDKRTYRKLLREFCIDYLVGEKR